MPGLTLNFPIKPGPPASTEEDVQMMKNYLFRLTEQLQYLFNNLGVENLTQDAIGQLAAAGAEAGWALLEGRLSGFQTAGQTEAAIAAAVGGLEGHVTPGVYPYFRIDSELGLLIGNAQIAYDPEKGLGIWPYEWGE